MLTLSVTFEHGGKMEDSRRRVKKGTIHREFSCPFPKTIIIGIGMIEESLAGAGAQTPKYL